MRHAILISAFFGELSVCSHAIVVKHDRHFTTGMDSDTEALDWKVADKDTMDGDAEALDGIVADDDTIEQAMHSPQNNQYIIADLDDVDRMMRVVTDAGEGSALESHETAVAVEADMSETLSPNARNAAHAAQFEAEFTVQVNMTRAHETGLSLGLVLQFDTDWEPTEVQKIRKTGLVQEWNNANPGRDVHVGDEIVQVNDIQWHHNTPNFVKRISGQFAAGRKMVPGASEMLTLYIQRPKRQSKKRYPMQREDAHHKAYPVEFDAELPVPQGGLSMSASENDVMGWELRNEHDWEPPSIGKLTGEGVVAEYNKANPDHAILAGDEIVKVNSVSWHHSAEMFEKRIAQQFESFRRQAAGSKPTLGLAIRRPAAVYKAAEAAKEALLASTQDPVDSIQSSVAPEPPIKTDETGLDSVGDDKPSKQRTAASLDEQIQAAASRRKALSAGRDEITRQISELVHRKMNISAELAAAEVTWEELESERDEALRRTSPPGPPEPAPGAGHGAPSPALPTELPPGAPEEDTPVPPENDDDVIGGYEDEDS